MTNEAPPTLDDAKLKSFVLQYSDLSFEKIIGSGANGDVYIGTHIPTKKRVAIKRLHDSETISQNDLPFRREIYTLSIIKNQFLLPFVGFTKTTPFCIVTRFISGGSLFSNLRKESEEEDNKKMSIKLKSKSKPSNTYLTATDLTIIALCIAKGMKYLHKLNIIHRDLKTQNILLDDKKLPVICDFGTSRRFDMLSNSKPVMTGQCGTPNYMAPEFIKNESYDQSVDVYSYGVILWEMLTRETPYGGKDAPQVIYMILSNKMLEIPDGTPENLKKLILCCWDVEPSHRPTFAQIVKMFNYGEVFYEGTNRKLFEKTVQSFTDERKGRRPRTKISSCEYQQTPVLNYIPSVPINNNNNDNNNNNQSVIPKNYGSVKKNASKKLTLNINNDFIQFNDYDDQEQDLDNDEKQNDQQQQQQQKDENIQEDENKQKDDMVSDLFSKENQQRPKIPKKAILNNEQRKNMIFRRHIAQLTTLYIRGIEHGTDQQIRNSIAFIESHANDPVLAKVEIWPKLLPVLCNSIYSKPGIVPALQMLSLRLSESPAVLASIISVQELHRFLRPETFDLFLYIVNFVPQAITIQVVKTLFTYALPQQQRQQQNIFAANQQQEKNLFSTLNENKQMRYSHPIQNPFAPPKISESPSHKNVNQMNLNHHSHPYNNYVTFTSSNEDFTPFANGGFGSFKQSILQDQFTFDADLSSPTEKTTTTTASTTNNNNNNNDTTTTNSLNKSGPSSMQIMSSQLSVNEKAIILLCLILGQFQNNYEISNLIITFFVDEAVNFVNVPGGHLVLRTLLNKGLVTEEMFTAFSTSEISENIVALYACIFSISRFIPNQNDVQNSFSMTPATKTNYVPNYFTLTQILEHMLSIYPRLRNCAYEFIYRHGDHAANKPLLSITETLLKSIMMYHPNGTERAILLLCRIACDSSSNSILLQEHIASKWLIKMSPITAPPLMRLFVILFKNSKFRTRLIISPSGDEDSPFISLSSTNQKHIDKYFENIAVSNSSSDLKPKKTFNYTEDIKLNRMSAMFLSNVVKNGDIQAFLTVCWVLSQASLNNEFVSILEDCEVIKIIAEKFNATKNVYPIRIICAALIQISKGFATYKSNSSKTKTTSTKSNANNNSQRKHKRARAYSSSKSPAKIADIMNDSFDFNSIPISNNNNDLLLKNSSSDFSLNKVVTSSSSVNTSDTNSLFSISTSSPSFIPFNDNIDQDSNYVKLSDSSAISTSFENDSFDYIPVLRKCSLYFDKIVLTCLKLISERNEASKECALLLTFLSSHKETHDIMMKANCIKVLSSANKSNEFVKQIKTIINNLKASGSVKNI